MNFKELNLKQSYTSDEDDLLNDFYIPVLSKSMEYSRIAGYFSSTSLAVASKGILELIENGGVMNLIASPELSKKDIEVIEDAKIDPDKYISDKMIDNVSNIENHVVRDHVYALGWMIANKKLNIKIATIYGEDGRRLDSEEINKRGIFHQKVAYLKDGYGNHISFSGSINETCSGWLDNIEEFKVFRGWQPIEELYCQSDIDKFDSYWNNKNIKVKTIDIYKAVEDKLVEISPRDIYEIESLKMYKKNIEKENKIILFEYQEKAIEEWKNNDCNGIFEMATGTGKTFTALGCVDEVLNNSKKLVTIIACPQNTLMLQWRGELKKFGTNKDLCIIADSTNRFWRNEIADSLMSMTLGTVNHLVILTTHRTLSSKDFIKIIRKNKRDSKIMLIADEVHGLGSKGNRKGLIDDYHIRLGLSATPRRWYDEKGTDKLYDYFRDIVYEFSIKDALREINPLTGKTYLVKYNYKPIFISLTEQELEEYNECTRKIIASLYKSNEEEYEELFELLLFQRANIQKNAEEKYSALEKILENIEKPINNLLIFVSPEQIDKVMKILKRKGIIAHRFTQDQGTLPESKFDDLSEREFIIEKFKEGRYQALVAIKCMDEGLDIPTADTAILMSSSTNPREYIQRIGRVIRQALNKRKAVIYDVIIRPNLNKINPKLRDAERSIFSKELIRAEEIAKNASNNAEALKLLYEV